MKKMNLKYGLIAVVAMGFSANVNAQEVTCDDITFNAQAFTRYASVDQACQEVVERNGAMYAKLLAQVQVQNNTGTRIKYYHRDGSWGKEFLVRNRNMMTSFDGKDVRVRDLAVRQEANVYLPATSFVVNEVVVAEVVEEVVEEYVAPPPPPEPVEEEAPVVLPTTAGPLPWLALFGSLFLLAGGALRFSRKQ
jgi:hypothetical protein